MSVLDVLLKDPPTGWRVTDIYVGENWILSLVADEKGNQRAGVASSPKSFPDTATYTLGHHQPDMDAIDIIQQLRSTELTSASVGLATLNALQQPDSLSHDDAADWLTEKSAGKNIAIFGRFPFIDEEVRPFAKQVFVFEQNPKPDEFGAEDMADTLPQADIIAITGTTVINHTLDSILEHTTPEQTIVLLGPSTPLTPRLFECGISALFGVSVKDIASAKESVLSGVGFQKMHGLERVAIIISSST